MLKAITHFEQIPLGLVMEIMDKDKQTEPSEGSRGKNEQNQSSVPAAMNGLIGADRD